MKGLFSLSLIPTNHIEKEEYFLFGGSCRFNEYKLVVTITDNTDREFLIDTLLHEYYEAEIMKRQYTDDFFKKLDNAGDIKRHTWINAQIENFFKEMEEENEVG